MAWIIKGKIAASDSRPKRARKKRKQQAVPALVTPAKLRPYRGPALRLKEQAPKRSAIVEPKRTSIFGKAPNPTLEELEQGGEAADALWRELTRRVNADD